jgi:hypothetical protein
MQNQTFKETKEELDQEALEYMRQWTESEGWPIEAILYNQGDVENLALYLVEAGAIDSSMCYEHCKKIEAYIEKLAKRFKSKGKYQKQLNETLKGTLVISCNDCNVVSYVNDYNEVIYPELLTECWECKSKAIKSYRSK